MSVRTYEGRIEQGQIRLRDVPVLPEGARVYVVIPETETESTGSPWVRELYAMFASVREDAAQYSVAEIDADIDAAVAAARGQHG
jgi:hypothetical protein